MAQLLEEIRALEWATFANGGIIGVMLGDLGADVIKVEQLGVGDPARGLQAVFGLSSFTPDGVNLTFENWNLNKRSVALDLKKEQGTEALFRLVQKSDIFYTNYSRSVATRLGLDYETLSKYNPQLIYANVSGFGRKGPHTEKRCFDTLLLARSGIMEACGERGSPPSLIVGAIADTMGATIAVLGILAALLGRERLGIGQEMDSSMLSSMIWLQNSNVAMSLLRGRPFMKHSRQKAINPLGNYYECSNSKWLMFAELQSDRYWAEFCQAVGINELEKDPRFESASKRRENNQELIRILEEIFAAKTSNEWIRTFEEKNVGFAYELVQSISDLATDPQVLANEYIVDYAHPILGPVKLVGFPVTFSKTPAAISKPAPELGQHTEEVLLEVGYTWDEIVKLKEQEVI